jgi:hypothetical protein
MGIKGTRKHKRCRNVIVDQSNKRRNESAKGWLWNFILVRPMQKIIPYCPGLRTRSSVSLPLNTDVLIKVCDYLHHNDLSSLAACNRGMRNFVNHQPLNLLNSQLVKRRQNLESHAWHMRHQTLSVFLIAIDTAMLLYHCVACCLVIFLLLMSWLIGLERTYEAKNRLDYTAFASRVLNISYVCWLMQNAFAIALRWLRWPAAVTPIATKHIYQYSIWTGQLWQLYSNHHGAVTAQSIISYVGAAILFRTKCCFFCWPHGANRETKCENCDLSLQLLDGGLHVGQRPMFLHFLFYIATTASLFADLLIANFSTTSLSIVTITFKEIVLWLPTMIYRIFHSDLLPDHFTEVLVFVILLALMHPMCKMMGPLSIR